MNQANFEKGRAAELALQKHFLDTHHAVIDLGTTPSDQHWRFPHARYQDGPLILPDMLLMRNGWQYYVEVKEKNPTKYGCFSVKKKNLSDARFIAKESEIDYALIVRNKAISVKSEADIARWIVTFPFNSDWIAPEIIQEYEDSHFFPLTAFQPLLPTLRNGPPVPSPRY
ncbi:hypothetical protein [Azospirillum tabaci]|uniref:hypothetical protein n=1 Tax=Azospirillum tabaci TaxID=2752310 RepID=UPI001660F9E6|nr:hypothetical protein [Azospirillum tabaci]